METPTTTTITVDAFPCQEDDVLTDDGACHNFEEVPYGLTVVADYCTAVNGTGFCEGTEQPATEVLARTGIEANLALLGLALILMGRFIVGLASVRRVN